MVRKIVAGPTKICAGCKEKKLLEQFGYSTRGPLGRTSRCKLCVKVDSKRKREANIECRRKESRDRYQKIKADPEKLSNLRKRNLSWWNKPENNTRMKERRKALKAHISEIERNSHIKRTYGLSKEDFMSIISSQGNSCGICRIPFSVMSFIKEGRKIRTAVDHDHDTGKVRGILCATCNLGIGFFGDNEEHLQMAIDYLRRHK